MAVVRSPDFLRALIRETALATLIHQRRLTPSCGGQAPTAERTVGPARMIAESLTPKPGIREQNRHFSDACLTCHATTPSALASVSLRPATRRDCTTVNGAARRSGLPRARRPTRGGPASDLVRRQVTVITALGIAATVAAKQVNDTCCLLHGRRPGRSRPDSRLQSPWG
jgi:hypothetical protein